MDALTRSNRFSYDPIIRDDGTPLTIEYPGHLDDARFHAMSPYDCMTADYIAVLSGAKGPFAAKSVTHRFNVLKREPNRWIDVHESQMKNPRNSINDFLAYSLPFKTKERLLSQGKDIHSYGCSGPLNHKLMASWIRGSYDIATKVEGVPATSIPFHEIIASPNTPAIKVKRGEPANCIPISINGKIKRVFPDCYPHAIRRHSDDEHFLILDETDCDTEALPEIEDKFGDYINIIENHVCRERYGFSKVYVTFESISQPHLDRMMKKLPELTRKASVLRSFLFKRHVSLKSITKEDRPRPTGHILTEDWLRAGGLPDFNMLKGE
jgi:hypothetical protein